MNAIILGANSDIAKAITPMLESDGYKLDMWSRSHPLPLFIQWDLLVIAIGRVAPVGKWWEARESDWAECIESNLMLPFRLLQQLWEYRNPDATVIWFAGSNPNHIMDGYSAYNTSKMAVLKLVEQLDHESTDCKFVALGPGYVKTKIHRATLEANWPNERIARGDDGNSMEDIYEVMRWCIEQRKTYVESRNICVSDLGKMITGDFGKLRRIE